MSEELIMRLAHEYEFAVGYFERQAISRAIRSEIHNSPGYKRQVDALVEITKEMNRRKEVGSEHG